ncbi:fibronectin type III domain-containing protein [Flavobacterium piscinae]|uniref:T9SS type A sorting domain-containing protein n=1 Tax=Flavobacterium piscinae TaxID=2506424 RepID=UPI0019C4EB52|nr:fibronectin type III domain-containing protein [Flavobacterium piscinae]MBC8882920.1 fibronectin type III domain-containing protein [Flavobacterium piscinae]
MNGQLTNLNTATTYYFWVRSNCGSDVSEWIAGPSFATTNSSGSGCVATPYGLYPSFDFTLVCLGTNETIVTDAYAGEYSNVNVIPDKIYTFSSSVATDYITITNEDASIIYASGTTPLVWNSETTTGVIRYYLHTNSTCGASNIERIKYIKCQFAIPPCNSPSNLVVSNILPTEAFLSWANRSPAPSVGYDVYLSTTNSITPATLPIGTVSGLSGQLTNLNTATTYYFWVRSNCGGTNVSEWVAGPSFTTTTPTGSGCISAPYGLYPTATFTPACTGTNETIVVDAYGGEYSNVNIVSNKEYTFTSSVTTDYITITNSDASIIYASGTTPLIWNSEANTGVIRYYFHTNSACGSADIDRIKSIQCQNESTPCNPPANLTVSNLLSNGALLNWTAASPAPSGGYDFYFSTTNSITPATNPTGTVTGLTSQLTNLNSATTYYFWVRSNCGGSDVSEWIAGPSFTTTPSESGCITALYGLYPLATFTPACTGTNETIVINAYAGEYSNVNIIANIQYTFTSSVATDFITITNADASIIYASGTTPLIWNSETNAGVIRYYFHTNSACGTSTTNRTKSIQCQDVVTPCNPPSNLTVSNVLSTSALLQWTAASSVPSGGYEIYFSTINSISPATTPSLYFVTLSGQLSNLNPSTTYYIWIRSNCDDSGFSDWIAGPSFTTTTPSGSGCLVAPYGLYPPTAFIPSCTETNETIATDAYAGEYSNISIIPNRVYTFESSVTTDFITITNADASIIYTSGNAPLVWNSETNSGTMRYYFHTDSDCGVSNSNRTKIIKCSATLSNSNFEKSLASVYPNPTKDLVNVVGENSFDKILILNSLGQKIKEINSDLNHVQIDLSTYSSGIYFIKVYQESNSQTYKIIKE